jgi:signal transduction histidine kinase
MVSTFHHLAVGTNVKLTDLILPQKANEARPRPELKLMSLDFNDPESPVVLFDIQPLWSKQDIRNRTVLFISSFALFLFIVSGITSMIILRSILRAIKNLEKDTAIVATGNLDHEVAGSANHEILHLARSINLMRLNLKDMLVRRSKMLMGISHDLKTPIALIQGYADALSDNVSSDAESQAKYIKIISTKARQLEDLTTELIDFLKIGGDGTIAVEDVDAGELFRRLGARFASDSQLLKRKFAWGFGDNLASSPAFSISILPMNRLLVERALENLVTNALKYSNRDGTIDFALIPWERGFAFSIRDEGPGIGEGDIPYVFDAFYRASPSRSDSGHGFGLTIVKAVADLHGWNVTIGSRRDGIKGTEALLIMH